MSSQNNVCVISQPISTGSQQHVHSLLQILGEIATVSLIASNLPSDSPIRDRYEVVDISASGTGNTVITAAVRFVYNQLRMAIKLWRREEQVILFFGTTSYVLPVLIAKISGKTVLLEPRGDVPLTLRLRWEQRIPALLAQTLAGLVRFLEGTGFALADRIVTYTPNMAQELGLDPESPKVYPHGARYVDTERFSVRVPFEEREDVVGFVGRLDEEKGIRELAEVAKRLPEDMTFRFVGDGPLCEWLESELREEIEAGNVELAGWIDHDDVPKELNRMKLLVMPSQPTEGLPTTILESMACGTPVYATPVSGVPDVVREGKTGFLMDDRTVDAIAERLPILFETDLSPLSVQCRDEVVSKFSFENAVERYRTLFSQFSRR